MVVFCGMNYKSRSPFSSQNRCHDFASRFFNPKHFRVGGSLVLPLHGLHFGLRISVIYPSLVSCHQMLKKRSGSLVSSSKFSWQHWRWVSFWKGLSILGTHLALTLDMSSFSWKMVQTAPAEMMPVSSANLDTFIRLSAKSYFPISGTFLQKSLPQDAQCEGHLQLTLFPT